MKIKLFGFGKMGKRVAELSHPDSICHSLKQADVAIDFSHKDVVLDHAKECISEQVPLVIGTTGWEKDLPKLVSLVQEENGSVLYAENFSLGIAYFLRAAKALSESGFSKEIFECHHKEKVDAPSGTAIQLARAVKSCSSKVQCERKDHVVGVHKITFNSPFETIELCHSARNRDGFAKGALLCAHWLIGKKGLFTINDVLEALCHRESSPHSLPPLRKTEP